MLLSRPGEDRRISRVGEADVLDPNQAEIRTLPQEPSDDRPAEVLISCQAQLHHSERGSPAEPAVARECRLRKP